MNAQFDPQRGQRVGESVAASAAGQDELHDRTIGEIIRQANNLTVEQVERILAHQKQTGLRFGEAGVALGIVKSDDVLWALAQQFHYPYALSSQPLNPELIVATQPFCEQAEDFRAMRSQLLMRMSENGARRATAVVSPDKGDGKTYFCANMAIAFSQLGNRTLLLDADMRNPRQHDLFGVKVGSSGLSSILSGRASGNVIQPVGEFPNLFLLPVGTMPPNPVELVERPAFALLMKELLMKFDHVVVDTPAASSGTDGAVIAARCGSAVAIARQNRTSMRALEDLLSRVSVGGVQIVGAVVNEF